MSYGGLVRSLPGGVMTVTGVTRFALLGDARAAANGRFSYRSVALALLTPPPRDPPRVRPPHRRRAARPARGALSARVRDHDPRHERRGPRLHVRPDRRGDGDGRA